MNEFILMMTTADNAINANKIAEFLVNNHLAACCNIIPRVTSVYRWEGEVTRDEEVIILIKTKRKLFDVVKENIINLNLYELPEVISFNISNGSDEYFSWLESALI